MLSIDLPPDVEIRLETLAEKAGRTKAECAAAAIRQFLDDADDAAEASARLRDVSSRWTLEDLESNRDSG